MFGVRYWIMNHNVWTNYPHIYASEREREIRHGQSIIMRVCRGLVLGFEKDFRKINNKIELTL